MAAPPSEVPRCRNEFLTGASGHWSSGAKDEILLDPFAELLRLAVMLRKRDIIAVANRARDAGEWGLAAQLYRKALDRDSHNPPIWVQYGHALKESGERRDPDKPAQAGAAYRRALSLDPGVADTYLRLGHVLKLQGKTDEAHACYVHALALDTSMPYPLYELGALGWSEPALAELQRLTGRQLLGPPGAQ
jgi:tetratricopeptide (TPR) repeat protein